MIRVASFMLALLVSATTAMAADRPIRIGVLNDMSSVYADFQGPGSVLAAQMAVEDYGGKAAGMPVEVLSADHQNKADIGAAIARRWFDVDGVDVIVDVPNSAVALAVAHIARERNKVFIGSGAGSAEITGAKCSPNSVHWTYDTWALPNGLAKAVVQRGGKSWFFITSDYAFGHDMEQNAARAVKERGGTVAGAVRHPLGAADYASYLVAAQSSGAQVVALANAGGDLTTSLKQAAEFGLPAKQQLVGLIVVLQNIDALGLQATAGLMSLSAFYWDFNEETRHFARRYAARHARNAMPNDMQAGIYSAVLHYLKAVEKIGKATDGKATVDTMKAIPTDDPLFGKGRIREDGRKLHPMYLLQTKAPTESKARWDYYKVISTIPADDAFRPLAEGGCPFVAK